MARWAREGEFDSLITSAAADAGLDPDLVRAVVAQESGFDPGATGDDGSSFGLMQLQVATASGVLGHPVTAAQLFDPATNLRAGCTYLAAQIRTAGNVAGGLSAYNGGWRPWLGFGAPPFKNQAYVDGVLTKWTYFRNLHAPAPGSFEVPKTDTGSTVQAVAITVAAVAAALLVWLLVR